MASVEQRPIQETATKSLRSVSTAWQKNLLPHMRRTLTGLTLFFVLASCLQLIYLNRNILNAPKVDTHEALSLLSVGPQSSSQEILAATRLKAVLTLEASALDHQYHQAGVFLMSRIWTTYLGFVTGMILALVGATFILGKLESGISELQTHAPNVVDLSFKSTSPGLTLAVLGVALMITTIVTHHSIDVKLRAVYLRESQSVPPESVGNPPPFSPPPFSVPDEKKAQ